MREFYDFARDEPNRAWFSEQRRVNQFETSTMPTECTRSDEVGFLDAGSSVPLYRTLRHFRRAFHSFLNKRTRYPRFDSRTKFRPSPDYTTSGVRWFAPIRVENSTGHYAPTVQAVGVDAGLDSSATPSNREKVTDRGHERRGRRIPPKAQRERARKERGSNERNKAHRKAARVHARITDRRKDHPHKVTAPLVREDRTVGVEVLPVRHLQRNRKLGRVIPGVGWREFRMTPAYRSACEVTAVDQGFPSSETRSECGTLAESMPLNVRMWTCSGCGMSQNRDLNAARNILAARPAVSAYGAGIRPQRSPPGRGGRLGSRNVPARAGQ